MVSEKRLQRTESDGGMWLAKATTEGYSRNGEKEGETNFLVSQFKDFRTKTT